MIVAALNDPQALKQFQEFRDGYMRETLERRKLLLRYYRVAPRIVEKLTKEDIVSIVRVYINMSSIALYDNEPKRAMELYRDMVYALQHKLL